VWLGLAVAIAVDDVTITVNHQNLHGQAQKQYGKR
jgi:hypothetical protein